MHIIFYKSKLCPRCFITRRHLSALRCKHPHLQIEEVEVLTSPLRAWRDGIMMVPALKIGDSVLSGLYLNKGKIANFLVEMSSKIWRE